jgi:putative toxin-antitoxin system antitoxin component (TIGR02293 family)
MQYLALMKKTDQLAQLSTYQAMNPQSLFKIIDQTNKGISYPAFHQLVSKMPFTLTQWAHFLRISKRTLERIREEKKVISPTSSEHILRIVMLYNYGVSVFGNKKNFDLWLTLESIPLGYIRPLDLLNNSYGIEAIRGELGRIEHGILS